MMSVQGTRKKRPGFTLIELMVVISVLLILMSFLMPSVQQSREAARRLQCQNNLRQLGLALNGYSSAHTSYPCMNVGYAGPPKAYTGFGCFSIHTYLLPFLDQVPVYQAINFSRPSLREVAVEGWASSVPHPANQTAAATVIATFMCPSDPLQSSGSWGGTNYRVNLGTAMDGVLGPDLPPLEGQNGAFVPLETLGPSAFTDGLSVTAAMSEKSRGKSGGPFDPRSGYWMNLRSLYTTQAEMIVTCRSLQGEPEHYQNDVGNRWFIPFCNYTFYKHDVGPNSAVPDCVGGWNSSDPALFNGVFASRGYHPGGVNTVFMDGHVQRISNFVVLQVWRAIASRNGREVVPGAF